MFPRTSRQTTAAIPRSIFRAGRTARLKPPARACRPMAKGIIYGGLFWLAYNLSGITIAQWLK